MAAGLIGCSIELPSFGRYSCLP